MSAASGAAAFAPRLMRACPDLNLREETQDDVPFLCSLYAATRAAEMSQVDWPPAQVQAFLAEQFALQAEHYRRHYLGAELLVIERAARPVGRIYVHRNRNLPEIRLMEIAVAESERRQGIATRLLRALINAANDDGCRITLHVEPDNPAQRIYARFGFTLVEDRGVYHFLGREPAPLAQGAAGEPATQPVS